MVYFFSSIFLSGCSVQLAKEQPIPPAPVVKQVNHVLSVENKEKIVQAFDAYQQRVVTGGFTAIINAVAQSSHQSSTDMKSVDLYDCTISRMNGNYNDPFFHRLFAIRKIEYKAMHSDVSRVITMNYNDVNEFNIYENKNLYVHKEGGFGLAIVSKDSKLDNITSVNYKCEIVPNKIF